MSAESLPIRLLLVDDHPVLRAGLVALLKLEPDLLVVGQASTGAAAVQMWRRCRPDVCLLDLFMPDMDGLETLRRILEAQPEARVVILTSSEAPADADRALAAGAAGYVTKSLEHEAILAAIRAVHRGGRDIRKGVLEQAGRGRAGLLSPRELEVLQLLRAGSSTREIARKLGITSRTVGFHVATILEKLDVADRVGAVAKAFDLGLLQPTNR